MITIKYKGLHTSKYIHALLNIHGDYQGTITHSLLLKKILKVFYFDHSTEIHLLASSSSKRHCFNLCTSLSRLKHLSQEHTSNDDVSRTLVVADNSLTGYF